VSELRGVRTAAELNVKKAVFLVVAARFARGSSLDALKTVTRQRVFGGRAAGVPWCGRQIALARDVPMVHPAATECSFALVPNKSKAIKAVGVVPGGFIGGAIGGGLGAIVGMMVHSLVGPGYHPGPAGPRGGTKST
jgi:hypothetical protein